VKKTVVWNMIVTLVLLLISLIYLYPTFRWYSFSQEKRDELERNRSSIIGRILKLGLDLKGGIHLILEVETEKLEEGTLREDAVDRALEIIRNRVDQFGVSEPYITRQGEKWIVVQLPGLKNPQTAIDLIGKTALLEFKLVDDQERLGEALEGEIPQGFEILEGKGDSKFLVRSETEITGAALTNAEVKIGGQLNQPYVAVTFNPDGAKKFARITGENIERRLAIILDNRVQSAPVIRDRIPNGKAIIEGNFTMEDATNLAIVLRAGALPAPVKIIENRSVGPSLGRDSIQKGLKATLYGGLVVLLFMLVYYKGSGLIADIALILDLLLLMGAMAYFHATLTLPGIAGIILTIGMAVDANVLIFTRIKEEIKSGKTVRVAIDSGYSKAFRTILDANLTTLIAAAFLFQFGTGPVKGFAVTLTFGIIISMFTAIVVTHTIYDMVLTGKKVEKLSI